MSGIMKAGDLVYAADKTAYDKLPHCCQNPYFVDPVEE